MNATGWYAPEINLQGVFSYANRNMGEARSYIQVFRSGVVEAVESFILDNSERKTIPSYTLEAEILGCSERCLGILKNLDFNPPVYIFISLTNVKGLTMGFDSFKFNYDQHDIQEENIHLPEGIIEDYDQKVTSTLRPLFDLVWNACGIDKSLNFDEQGNWMEKR